MSGELFASSFLGFLSALATEWVWERAQQRRTAQTIVRSLREEAKRNLSRFDTDTSPQHAFLGFFDSTAWSAAVSTNQLDSISSAQTVEAAARMYRRLETAERWDALRIQARIIGAPGGSVLRDLDSIVTESRRLARESIAQFLEESHA